MKTNNIPLNHGRTGRPYALHADLPLNAFQSVRPRGEDRPSAVPARPHKGPEPTVLKGSYVRVLDRNGRLSAPLAPRIGTLAVEGQKAGQASADRPRCAVRGLVAPGGMCGAVIVGGVFCGSDKPCEHKVTLDLPRKSLGHMLIATRPCGRMAGFCWDDAGEKAAAEWTRAMLSEATGNTVIRVERFQGDPRPEEICMECRGRACREGGAA